MRTQPYLVTVALEHEVTRYIAPHRSGFLAIRAAMRLFPTARKLQAKPVNAYRA